MATTDYDFNLTRSEIIQRAFRIVGVLGEGQTLSGEQSEIGRIALNTLVKHWQTRSVFLWTLQEDSAAYTAGLASKALDNSILGIERAWYKSGNDDVEMSRISFREYELISNKTSESAFPSVCALSYDKATPTLYIYPASSATVTVYFIAVKRLQDMDSAGGNADIPQRFLQALVYGLADLLSDEYGINLRERQYIKSKYDEYFLEAQRSDYEWEEYTVMRPAFNEWDV